MTADDLTRVETALAIRLPAVYRDLVVPFPIPAYAGNADTELWDDPDALIALNRELRAGDGAAAPWPEHLFAIGRDGSGCASAIDLRDPMAPVWWADRCHLDAVGTAQESPSLVTWAEQHLADLRVELEEKCVSEAAPPSERAKADAEGARAEGRFMLAIVGVGALLVFAAWLTVKFLAP
jgi:hypothetical protein